MDLQKITIIVDLFSQELTIKFTGVFCMKSISFCLPGIPLCISSIQLIFQAYYGGEARCDEQAAVADEYDPTELVCGGCSDVSRAQMCPKHGTDFLEYKCRYCCSVAVFFCFGTTHFCNACHDDFQRVTNIPKSELPHCPAGEQTNTPPFSQDISWKKTPLR
jgi:hypothetical protein